MWSSEDSSRHGLGVRLFYYWARAQDSTAGSQCHVISVSDCTSCHFSTFLRQFWLKSCSKVFPLLELHFRGCRWFLRVCKLRKETDFKIAWSWQLTCPESVSKCTWKKSMFKFSKFSEQGYLWPHLRTSLRPTLIQNLIVWPLTSKFFFRYPSSVLFYSMRPFFTLSPVV